MRRRVFTSLCRTCGRGGRRGSAPRHLLSACSLLAQPLRVSSQSNAALPSCQARFGSQNKARSAAQCSAAQSNIAQCSTEQHSTVQHSAVPLPAPSVQRSTAQRGAPRPARCGRAWRRRSAGGAARRSSSSCASAPVGWPGAGRLQGCYASLLKWPTAVSSSVWQANHSTWATQRAAGARK